MKKINKSDIEDAYPMSMLQQGMIYHSMQNTGLNFYHTQHSYHLLKPWQAEKFNQALNYLVNRHPILRTVFNLKGSRPLQLVMKPQSAEVEWVDVRDLDEDTRKTRVVQWLQQEKEREFNVEQLPWRMGVHVFSDEAFVLAFTFHHAILDGWSNASLISELLACYSELLAGNTLPNIPPPPSFKHYIALEQKALQNPAQSKWWKQQFDQAQLPWWSGEHLQARSVKNLVMVPAQHSQTLMALSKQLGVQEKSVWSAIYVGLLWLLNGHSDVVGSVIVHGRPEIPDGDKTLGLFLNALPFRVNIRGLTWVELIKQMETQMHLLQENRYYPLVSVQQHTQLDFSASIFNYTHFHVYADQEVDQQIAGDGGFEEANYRFAFQLTKNQDQHIAHLDLDPSVFNDAYQAQIKDLTSRLIEQCCLHPHETINKLALIAQEPMQQALHSASNLSQSCPSVCVHELVESQASHQPEAVAVADGSESITYGTLDKRANQLARYLMSKGVKPEVRVGVCITRCTDMVVTMLAILKAGGAYVPLDPAYPGQRLNTMLQKSQCLYVMSHTATLEQLPILNAFQPLLIDDLHLLAALQNESDKAISRAESGVMPNNLANIIFTSGSSGEPKDTGVTHRNISRLLHGKMVDIKPGMNLLCTSSVSFDVLSSELWNALCHGGRSVMVNIQGLTPAELGEYFANQHADCIFTTTALFNQIVDIDPTIWAPFSTVFIGGEALSKKHVLQGCKALPNTQLMNAYGPTESTAISSIFPIAAEPLAAQSSIPIGLPINHTCIYILDEQGIPAISGASGELHIGGEGLVRGYLSSPALTAQRFVPDPYSHIPGARLYKSGDLARVMTNWGEAPHPIEFLGRLDSQVKIRGFRIEPGEIEHVLKQHPGVKDAVVMVQTAQRDAAQAPYLVAYAVPNHFSQLDELNELADLEAALLSECQQRLPHYMVPRSVMLLAQFPVTVNGKLDRNALPTPEFGSAEQRFEAPVTPTEQILAGLWREILQVQRVGRGDDFFALGGQSLLATQLASRIHEVFSVAFPLVDLFEHTDLQRQAARIDTIQREEESHPYQSLQKADREQPLLLSFAQQRLWFIHQYMSGDPGYNIPLPLQITGEVQYTALVDALNWLVERHESLRTRFAQVDNQVVQVIDEQPASVEVETLRTDAELLSVAQAEQQYRFDLAEDNLCRIRLFDDVRPVHGELSSSAAPSPESHTRAVLLVTMHHSISDGWSMNLFFNELVQAYHAFCQGETVPLPPLNLQYADFAQWQRKWLGDEVLNKQLAYWRKQLQHLPERLTLPTDRPRPAQQTHNGSRLNYQCDAALTEKLNQFSSKQGVTLYMTLISAFAVLMGRWSGQQDIAIGTPIANRNHKDTEALIGFFVNTLVMRCDLRKNPHFTTLVKQVRKTALQAYAHQDVPFEALVDAINPSRNTSFSPLFQVMFSLQNMQSPFDEEDSTQGNIQFRPLDVSHTDAMASVADNQPDTPEVSARYDLWLTCTESNNDAQQNTLFCTMEYNTDLFDAGTIRRMLGQFEQLLLGLVSQPRQPTGSIDCLLPEERQLLLADAPDHAAMADSALAGSEPAVIQKWFNRQVQAKPHAIAVSAEHENGKVQQLSYAELHRRAAQVADALSHIHLSAAKGVDEPRFGLCVPRGLAMVEGMSGIVQALGCYVALDPQSPLERRKTMAQEAQLSAIVTLSAFAEALAPWNIPLICLDAMPEPASNTLTANDHKPCTLACKPNNLAYIQFTSGTTGTPKGVMGLQGSVVNRMRWFRDQFTVQPADRYCQKTRLSFVDHIAETLQALCTGVPLHVIDDEVLQTPRALGETLSRWQVSQITLVPSLLKVLQTSEVFCAPSVQLVCSSGENLALNNLDAFSRAFPTAQLWNIYGSTEVGADVLCHNMSEQLQVNCMGEAISQNKAYVLDKEGNLAPFGVVGELYIAGQGLARGYWGQAGQTAERFVPNPFSGIPGDTLYRTGDLARFASNGKLDYVGRVDNQVKLRGIRIEPGEIEQVLMTHPAVNACAVVLQAMSDDHHALVAHVVLTQPGLLEPEQFQKGQSQNELSHKAQSSEQKSKEILAEISAFAQAHLPDYMVPARFGDLATLPLNASGKVNRSALPRLEMAKGETLYQAPQDDTERLLAQIWQALLNVERVGRQDNFFALGGHSLLATQLVARIDTIFGVAVSIRQVFEYQTLSAQAQLITQDDALDSTSDSMSDIQSVARNGSLQSDTLQSHALPLSYAQQRLWFLSQMMGANSVYNSPHALQFKQIKNGDALLTALVQLIERHEVLRSRFEQQSDDPQSVVQIIEPKAPALTVETVPNEQVLQQKITAEQRYPFDLSRDRLSRMRLFNLQGTEDYVWVAVLHHSICDGWSSTILFRDLIALYKAVEQGSSAQLPPLPFQYADYAVAQRDWMQNKLAGQLDYWREELAGVPPLVDLPTDFPRPAKQSYRGNLATLSLPAELSASLHSFCQSRQVTLFMTMLSAFAVLLGRYSRQGDIAISTSIANRHHKDTENLIGFFVNTLVIRCQHDPGDTFSEVLQGIKEKALKAYANQDVPFERLVEEVNPERSLSYAPLSQVMFNMQNLPTGGEGNNDIAVAPVAFSDTESQAGAGVSRLDLTISIREQDDCIVGDVEYNSDLFTQETIQRLLAHYETLLGAVVAQPDMVTGQINIATPLEKQQQWQSLSQTQNTVLPELCVHQLFEQQVAERGDVTALIVGNSHFTYRQLNRRANQLARLLLEQGLTRESGVLVLLERSFDWVVAMLAVMKAAGVYIPLDPAHPEQRNNRIVDRCQASVLITVYDLEERLENIPDSCILLDDEYVQSELDEQATNNLAAHEAVVLPQQLSHVIYTSGSTGLPKGVCGTHRNLVNRLVWGKYYLKIEPHHVFAQKTNVAFVDHLSEVLQPLCCGNALVFLQEEWIQIPDTLNQVLKTWPVSHLTLVPSLLVQLLASDALQASSLEAVCCSGEAMPVIDATRFAQCFPNGTLFNIYGSSEVTADVTAYPVFSKALAHPYSVMGSVVDNNELYVLDEFGNRVPMGGIGELYVGGACIARGYYQQPGLTAARFVPNPFAKEAGARLFQTGDLVRYCSDGELRYVGRADHQMNIRGFRVEPGEVELAVERHPGIEKCIVRESNGNLIAYVKEKPAALTSAGNIDMSLFFFAADDAYSEKGKYNLVVESAKKADELGFKAIWTPERHFTEVAGLYPNPSVLSAALAMVTQRIQLRAGSVVMPLHHPIRVAEEWSVVDNLSNGRVGLSFVPGWVPDDFCLAKDNFADRRDKMFQGIKQLQALWRGESLTFENGLQQPKQVSIYPTPVQEEVPIWLTCPGDPRMFEKAGEMGANIITALLSQPLEEVQQKVALYRESLRKNGYNPDSRTVTLMMHTYIHPDQQVAEQTAAQPFINYMRSHIGLVSNVVESFDINDVDMNDEGHLNEMAELAYQRYLQSASLIGSPESCQETMRKIHQAGIDEVACLMDFGLTEQQILDSLEFVQTICNIVMPAQSQSDSLAIDANLLKEQVRASVPHYMVPDHFAPLHTVPLTPSGKIDRRALPEIDLREVGKSAYVAPENDMQETLCSMVQQVLNIPQVGINDNFFDLGGHSLLSLQFIGRIREHWQVQVPLTSVFEQQTVKEYAAYLESRVAMLDVETTSDDKATA